MDLMIIHMIIRNIHKPNDSQNLLSSLADIDHATNTKFARETASEKITKHTSKDSQLIGSTTWLESNRIESDASNSISLRVASIQNGNARWPDWRGLNAMKSLPSARKRCVWPRSSKGLKLLDLPAPLSPFMMIDWLCLKAFISL